VAKLNPGEKKKRDGGVIIPLSPLRGGGGFPGSQPALRQRKGGPKGLSPARGRWKVEGKKKEEPPGRGGALSCLKEEGRESEDLPGM